MGVLVQCVILVFAAVRAWRDARRLDGVVPPVDAFRRSVVFFVGAVGALATQSLLMRTVAVQAIRMPAGSMRPTLEVGDHFLVDKLVYGPRLEFPFTHHLLGRLPGRRRPAVGDVIMFAYPKDPSKDFVKRVVAVEGQTVKVQDRHLYVDGALAPDPHANWTPPAVGTSGSSYGPYTVPEGTVFTMGDNRDQSYDSRAWGPVPLANVKGRALVIYWSAAPEAGTVRWERLGQGIE